MQKLGTESEWDELAICGVNLKSPPKHLQDDKDWNPLKESQIVQGMVSNANYVSWEVIAFNRARLCPEYPMLMS